MTLKSIAAIGDIHTEDELLEKAINFCRGKVDLIVTVGDVVDGKGDVNRCCSLLRQNNVSTVRGNHERWLVSNEMRVLPHANQIKDIDQEHMQWLRDLPATLDFDTVGGSLLLCHGLGKNDMKTLLPDESGYALSSNEALENLLYETSYRFVIKGHSHTRMVRRIDRITFINAGTLRATSEPCFCIIDFEKKQLQFFDFINSEITPLDAVPLP